MKAKKGISLIVLVITIIVIIILAGAVILNLTKNNPMNSAKVASLTSTREALESAVLLYTQQIIAATNGDFDAEQILSGTAVKIPDDPATTGTNETVYYDGIVTGTAVTGVNAKTYRIDAGQTSATIDMALPTTPTGSYWCVDVTSGKCYLVFDSAASFPTYMGATTSTGAPYLPDNATLAGFVIGLAA